jgi:hypothetical protein
VKSTLNSASFYIHKPQYLQNQPFYSIVHEPEKNFSNEGQVIQSHLYDISLTFARYTLYNTYSGGFCS